MNLGLLQFRFFIGAVRRVTETCFLKFTPEGIDVLAVDRGNVALVAAKLPVTNTINGTIAVDLNTLERVLNRLDENPDLSTILGKKSDIPWIVLETEGVRGSVKALSLSDIRPEPKRLPDFNYLVQFTVSGPTLKNAIDRCANISDRVAFWVEGNTLKIGSGSVEDDETTIITTIRLPHHHQESLHSSFEYEYLSDMVKSMGQAGNVQVHIRNDYPIRFDFTVHDVSVTYALAPRIVAEE